MKRILRQFIPPLLSLHLRTNRAARFCRYLEVVRPVRFQVDRTINLRCRLICEDSVFVARSGVAVEGGSRIQVLTRGTINLEAGVKIGPNSSLEVAASEVSIGENTTFHSAVSLLGSISIGKNCLFAPNISILSSSHVAKGRLPIRERYAEYIGEHGGPPDFPVTIGDEV